MATFAPCSAKRTAIAWPMPDVPPVTSTFLPLRPRMPSLAAVSSVVVMSAPPTVEMRVCLAAPASVTPSAREAHELSARTHDEPEAAELEDVLAEHLAHRVVDVVVEGPAAVGQLPPPVAPARRPVQRALRSRAR